MGHGVRGLTGTGHFTRLTLEIAKDSEHSSHWPRWAPQALLGLGPTKLKDAVSLASVLPYLDLVKEIPSVDD